jgi:hypothetical protein
MQFQQKVLECQPQSNYHTRIIQKTPILGVFL